MPSLTLVKLLWCGQGMTTLVEIYDDGVEKGAADYLALIDCGGSPTYGKDAVNHIKDKVAKRTTTPNKMLDLVVISHQDDDHNGLLGALGKELKTIDARVGSVHIGGLSWIQGNKDTVNEFLTAVKYAVGTVVFDAPAQSDYPGGGAAPTHFAVHKDVKFRLLISNLDVPGATADIVRNGSSAVVVVDNGVNTVVLPGDATFQTMLEINTKLGGAQLTPQVLALEIPHHGALRTAVENYAKSGKKKTDFTWTIIEDFATKVMKPKNVGASAGPWNTDNHPVQEVIDVFIGTTDTVPSHTYVAFVFFQKKTMVQWATVTTLRAVETTIRQLILHQKKRKLNAPPAAPPADFVVGHIVYRLTGTPGLRPEEMVEFRPCRTFGMHGPDEDVVQAPEP
ncbi:MULTISPECIES: MBL fold metallo-hydrolase [unclassified Streptomyces]|uniref:MBL fold metallo-hydrolase n=1 Tax=unclassified Streptomyces TaxID=2593676 RepID=UPI003441DBA8